MLSNLRPAPALQPVSQLIRPGTPLKPDGSPMLPQPVVPTLGAVAQQVSPGHIFTLYASAGLLLVYFATLPEFLYLITGVPTYVLYIFGPAAFVSAVLSGAIQRTFRERAPFYYMGFVVCMFLATVTSTWMGGSASRLSDYVRFVVPLLFVAGGVPLNWKQLRVFLYTIASAAVLTLLMARLLGDASSGRINLGQNGATIGNSNDLAAHLIIVLPFLLYAALDTKRNIVLRIFALGGIGYGLWVILGTGSRGALIALIGALGFLLWRASRRQRIGTILCLAVAGVIVVGAVPQSSLRRLGALFGEQSEEATEARESQASRSYLFYKSVDITFEHPVLGVGPDQFTNFEGGQSVKKGEIGDWHAIHCAFTQVSSENGIPALILFLSGIVSAFLLVHRTWRTARARGYPDIINACLCYELAMVGFLIAVAFLSNAYRFYFPAMIGLAVSISFAAAQTMGTNPIAAPSGARIPVPPSSPAVPDKSRPNYSQI